MTSNSTSSRGQIASVSQLKTLVDDGFPNDEIVYAFGYGSGVFSQQLETSQSPIQQENMMDLILVVHDSYNFHRANLSMNPHHYSTTLFAADPAARITWWQRHVLETRIMSNPRVYFNVTDGLKYGIVQVDDLKDDLLHWKYLYLAGRMQKPTLEIVNRMPEDRESIRYIQREHNLQAALSAALLLLLPSERDTPSSISLSPTQIFTQIAALSYTGDFRTTIGAEDPYKITKLVSAPGQLQRFHDLYQQCVRRLHKQGVLQASYNSDSWSVDSSPSARDHLWSRLPTRLLPHSHLQGALVSIVAPAARYQSLKGLATAGISRSAAYGMRKLSKGLFRFIK